MTKIGFLTFGRWSGSSRGMDAAEAIRQTVELAVAAEELGVDGAFVRVHHFEQSLSSPFPLLAAIGARTSRIEIGTGVVDFRYENPAYSAEAAAVADLIAGGRLQLGVGRGSPQLAVDGEAVFGVSAPEGRTLADLARERVAVFRDMIAGSAYAHSTEDAGSGFAIPLPIQPQAPGLADRIWWGSGTQSSAEWAGREGMHLMSSTLLGQDTGKPFHVQQAEQLRAWRRAYEASDASVPGRASVSRSITPILSEQDEWRFGALADEGDQIGQLEGVRVRSGPSYVGTVEQVAARLAADEAVAEADTLLVTIPNQLGVDDNARLLESIVRDVAPLAGLR